MKKRLKKKRDKKLFKAIVELNQMVADDLEEEFEWGGIPETFKAVKSSHKAIQMTFADYKRYILKR
jgi:hypothetical protein